MEQPLEDYVQLTTIRYPEITAARNALQSENFTEAVDLYSQILSAETVDEDDPTRCYVFLEYAEALIENSCKFFIYELQLLRQKKIIDEETKKTHEADLETAWELLEICRLVFMKIKRQDLVARAYFLLGNIQTLNNEFLNAIADYTQAYDLLNLFHKQKTEKMVECLFKISEAYAFIPNYDETIKTLGEIVCVYEELRNDLGPKTDDLINTVKSSILYYQEKKNELEGRPKVVPQNGDHSNLPIVDINMNKKKKK